MEHEHPNDLWQMDFKGYIELDSGRRCLPFTVLDDHSRFDLALDACGSTPTRVVREHLRAVFRRYGLPLRINADNGPPWGSPARPGQLSAGDLADPPGHPTFVQPARASADQR